MRCILDRAEPCLFEKCRYFDKTYCILENIDRDGWPDKDCRRKPEDRKDIKEMSMHGPGNIQA